MWFKISEAKASEMHDSEYAGSSKKGKGQPNNDINVSNTGS